MRAAMGNENKNINLGHDNFSHNSQVSAAHHKLSRLSTQIYFYYFMIRFGEQIHLLPSAVVLFAAQAKKKLPKKEKTSSSSSFIQISFHFRVFCLQCQSVMCR